MTPGQKVKGRLLCDPAAGKVCAMLTLVLAETVHRSGGAALTTALDVGTKPIRSRVVYRPGGGGVSVAVEYCPWCGTRIGREAQ